MVNPKQLSTNGNSESYTSGTFNFAQVLNTNSLKLVDQIFSPNLHIPSICWLCPCTFPISDCLFLFFAFPSCRSYWLKPVSVVLLLIYYLLFWLLTSEYITSEYILLEVAEIYILLLLLLMLQPRQRRRHYHHILKIM